jgi:hypothetical protein
MWEFGPELRFRWVMGGLARRFDDEWATAHGLPDRRLGPGMALHWLEVAGETRMPFDPLLWTTSPPSSSYPACMGVKAAAEQGPEAAYRYLRRLREGLMAERRKLDHAEALVGAAAEASLDAERFRVDLGSHAITEAFGADLEETRQVPEDARRQGAVVRDGRHERLPFPSAVFLAADGSRHGVYGRAAYDDYRAAALAAGASQIESGPLDPEEAAARFGRLATIEAEELSRRPAPVIGAELWAAARDWRLKPVPALIGELWEAA